MSRFISLHSTDMGRGPEQPAQCGPARWLPAALLAALHRGLLQVPVPDHALVLQRRAARGISNYLLINVKIMRSGTPHWDNG